MSSGQGDPAFASFGEGATQSFKPLGPPMRRVVPKRTGFLGRRIGAVQIRESLGRPVVP